LGPFGPDRIPLLGGLGQPLSDGLPSRFGEGGDCRMVEVGPILGDGHQFAKTVGRE
jgi:hypothetical protein